MRRAVTRIGIALGALVEAALVLWLIGGFLPAGLPLGLVTVVLGYLIYRDIPPSRGERSLRSRPVRARAVPEAAALVGVRPTPRSAIWRTCARARVSPRSS